MYSSSSSSSQHSAAASDNNNLTRYGSAPSSFLSNVAESVSGLGLGLQQHQQYFPESTQGAHESRSTLPLLHDSYGNNNNSAVKANTVPNLLRHSSSPPGFLNHLTSELGYCNNQQQGGSRLGSQLSFTKQDHHSLSQIHELNESSMLGGMTPAPHDPNPHKCRASSSSGFSLSSWDDTHDGFTFSNPSNKRNKNSNDDFLNGLASMESQEIAFGMTSMDRLLHIPQDSVPCKIRAKRGFATHPRSIAERERRTRISGKLKKLQDLVPNMDKQTSYADMLDLAVQHIKGLQSEVQKLNSEVERCTCGCKKNIQN